MDKNIEKIISLLQQGKQLSEEHRDILFPIDHAEYELTYKGKTPKEQIISVGEEPQGVPFQIEKNFGKKQNADEWQNLLMFGDNFQVLKTIHENKDPLIQNKVKDKVKLIYIDPPFATQDEFANKDGAKAYNDKIKGAEFIEFLRQRLILAREILASDGSIYVYLDSKMVHYIKVLMDEVFGKNNFQREIIWDIQVLSGFKTIAKNWIRGHETILYYSKTENRIFNKLLQPHTKEYLASFKQIDENGRKFMVAHGLKRYLDEVEARGKPFGDVWNGIKSFQQQPTSAERVDYPTQKPETLLERIIKASTNEGDLVMDFFAGSGTTLAVSEKLNRRWIGVDIGKLAIYTIQKRLLTLPCEKPFALVNAGCYDLKKIFEMEKQKYIDFVCELFHVEKQPKKVNGIAVDGKRRGDWVKIYEWQDFNETHTAVDEAFVEELHRNIGEKIGEKFYIIAPEMNVDIVGDYYRPSESTTKYYLLKIPYQYIKDLHKIAFKKLNQPKSNDKINAIENSVGFYFNEKPEVKSHLIKTKNSVALHIDECTSPLIQTEKDILAMVLIDDTNDENFIMQKAYFADDIKHKTTGKFSITLSKDELKSNKLKVVYIDIYGNEFMEVLGV